MLEKRGARRKCLLTVLVVFFALCLLAPGAGACEHGEGKSREIRVLYLGNDYYQEVPGGLWLDANHFIIEALEASPQPRINVTHREPWAGKIEYPSLGNYDVVIFSEVWSSMFTPEQLEELERFVMEGGGFVMFGGWGGYGGYDQYGEWDETVVEGMLPVNILCNEDAVEMTFRMGRCSGKHGWAGWPHPVARGINLWKAPPVYGYNRVEAKNGTTVVLVNPENGDPILVVGNYGCGRVVALTTNPTGYWGKALPQWIHYSRFLANMVAWSAGLGR